MNAEQVRWLSIDSESIAISAFAGFVLLSMFLGARNGFKNPFRLAVLTLVLVVLIAVPAEIVTIIATVGKSWSPMPWAIAVLGACGLSCALWFYRKGPLKVPLLRRRGATNIATLALFTTVFWETFIYNPELAREGLSTALCICIGVRSLAEAARRRRLEIVKNRGR